jgi:hypothetical protein
MAINYTKKTWQNAPSTATPLSAANVQIMDNAIEAACDGVDELSANLAINGTFIPTIKGLTTAGTFTTIFLTGEYAKAGKLVFVAIMVRTTAIVGAAGILAISNLPYTPFASLGTSFTVQRYTGITLSAGRTQISGALNGNDIIFYSNGSGASSTAINITNLGQAIDLFFSGVYIAAT